MNMRRIHSIYSKMEYVSTWRPECHVTYVGLSLPSAHCTHVDVHQFWEQELTTSLCTFTDFQENDIEQIEPDYLFPFVRRLLNLRAAHDGYRPPEDKAVQLDPSKMTVTVDVVKTDLNMLWTGR